MIATTSSVLPIIPLKGMVVFPTNVMHIDVGRDQSIGSLKYSLEHDQLIFLTMQKQARD